MKTIVKINKIIVKLEEVIIAAGILVLSVILIGNVLGRLLFDKGIYATEEIGSYCIYAITFFGLSYAVTTGKHINMLGLFDMTPAKFQKADALLISAVTAVTMGVLTALAFQYVATLKLMGKVSINLQIPMYLVVAAISLGFLFATIQYILIFIKNLQCKEIYLGLEKPYEPDFRREEKTE